jgi:hypothetical protein
VPIQIGQIMLNNAGGLGTLNLISGAGGDQSFGDITLDPNTVLTSAIPEPGTLLLLGAGLTGLVLQGSRRREN